MVWEEEEEQAEEEEGELDERGNETTGDPPVCGLGNCLVLNLDRLRPLLGSVSLLSPPWLREEGRRALAGDRGQGRRGPES